MLRMMELMPIKMANKKNLAEAALHLTRMDPSAALQKKKLWNR